MEKPSTIRADEGATVRLAAPAQADPVLLALPRRRTNHSSEEQGECSEPCREQLHVIEVGSGPKVEAALLKDLLTRSPDLQQALADPCEVQNYANTLAAVNAYKHRLHALRCEFVNVRLRIYDLETKLDQSCYDREVLQKRIRFLEATLEQMRASRAWKLAEKCSLWSRSLSQRLRRVFSAVGGEQ